ncbi:MAG: SDR family oxidoreductase [Limnohabitans sp.]|nr:SDR family oxidoreductase [Limnohabitans sp.]
MTTHQNQADRKIALITGSSRGIGLAIAKKLLADGYRVILNGSNNTQLQQVHEQMAQQYPLVDAMSANVSDEDSVAQLFQQIENIYTRLDVLVNNAGISPRLNGNKPTVETTPTDHWVQTIAINLTGAFFVTRAAIPLLKHSKCGRVIQIASQAGQMNTGFASAHYATSKAGLIGFSRILAGELGPLGITVNFVSPGKIQTEMAATYRNAAAVEQAYIDRTPMQRIG